MSDTKITLRTKHPTKPLRLMAMVKGESFLMNPAGLGDRPTTYLTNASANHLLHQIRNFLFGNFRLAASPPENLPLNLIWIILLPFPQRQTSLMAWQALTTIPRILRLAIFTMRTGARNSTRSNPKPIYRKPARAAGTAPRLAGRRSKKTNPANLRNDTFLLATLRAPILLSITHDRTVPSRKNQSNSIFIGGHHV